MRHAISFHARSNRYQAANAQREAEMERMRQQARGGGGGRLGLGRGDTRNFSAGYGQAPPPDNSGRIGTDDLRRLNKNATSRQVSHAGGPGGAFAPGGLLGSRSNSGRKGLGPQVDLSGGSSRTGTPPAQKDKEKKDDAQNTNAFR